MRLWEKVRNELLREIEQAAPGEKIGTLREITGRFQVSGITARRALEELARAGRVEKIPGRGTIVRAGPSGPRLEHIVVLLQVSRDRIFSPSTLLGVTQGVLAEAAARGIAVDFFPAGDFPATVPVPPGRRAGCLVFQRLEAPAYSRFLRAHGCPVLFLHPPERLAGESSVRVDIRHGSYLATSHLAARGHRRIALMTSLLTEPYYFPRFRGYQKALREAGLKFDWSLVRETPSDEPVEIAAALRGLLARPRPPSAIFAGNDTRAAAVLDYCRQAGISVPGQLSVAGYDNSPAAAFTRPPLTTVDTRLREVGRAGVRRLCEITTGEAKQAGDIIIKPILAVRASTAAPGGS